jgi:ubiquitin carboxyl-terminal hydrolase MINDY-1/2
LNILILRELIEVPGEYKDKVVSYDFLEKLVHEYIEKPKSNLHVFEALKAMSSSPGESHFSRANTRSHSSRKLVAAGGVHFNPVFTAPKFSPINDELKLFATVGILLVHGWIVDPESEEYPAVSHVENYESAHDLIADDLTEKKKYKDGEYLLEPCPSWVLC